MILGLLLYLEISKLKKQVKSQQIQIDALCKKTGNYELTTYYISGEDKEYILHLKHTGKEIEAINKLRELTAMELVEEKEFVDKL